MKWLLYWRRLTAWFGSKDNRNAFFLRLGFILSIVVCVRLFLGVYVNRKIAADMMTSVSMMLLLIFSLAYIRAMLLRRTLLLFAGLGILIFHLVYGLYYRFFNCPLPFDILRQWRDTFVVGGDGLRLMSPAEWILAVIVPLIFLVWMLFRPFRPKGILLVLCAVVCAAGWGYRLTQPMQRTMDHNAALPDFLARYVYWRFGFGLQDEKYDDIIDQIDTRLPRVLSGYEPVDNKGVLVEPIDETVKTAEKKYNVILILMESMRAYECGFVGADPSFTPNLDQLAVSARVYSNFYANSYQTVRAEMACLASVYSNSAGTPTYLVNPNIDIIALPEILALEGYRTMWFSGYTADFHNKRKFLSAHGVREIYDRDVLPPARQPLIGWGMNDQEMFGSVWEILKKTNRPFFAQITTLSNHYGETAYPCELNLPAVEGDPVFLRYMKGSAYTDLAVAEFVKTVRSSSLASNTIIIAVGDHGIWLFPSKVTDPLQKWEIYFRVPMCVWGPLDVVKPGVDNTLGSQIDIAPTLMDMLNIRHENTFLGNSLINKNIPLNKRCAVSCLGGIPYMRTIDGVLVQQGMDDAEMWKSMGAIPRHQFAGDFSRMQYLTIQGDLLRGNYIAQLADDSPTARHCTQMLEDITFLTTYAVYFNAYLGE